MVTQRQRTVFVFESLSGGGWSQAPTNRSTHSLLEEGSAMCRALCEDIAALKKANLHTIALWDGRLGKPPSIDRTTIQSVNSYDSLLTQFDQNCREADAIIIIAPEIDNELNRWIARASLNSDRLISGTQTFANVCSDKWQCYLDLKDAGVPTIETRPLEVNGKSNQEAAPTLFAFPHVVKPRFGAGSVGIQLRSHPSTPIDSPVDESSKNDSSDSRHQDLIVQPLMNGIAASVSFLASSLELRPLVACFQELDPTDFSYTGSQPIVDRHLTSRAFELGQAAIAAIGSTVGYVGVDVLLSECLEDQEDLVVEINPRVTSSYHVVRKELGANVMRQWLELAEL